MDTAVRRALGAVLLTTLAVMAGCDVDASSADVSDLPWEWDLPVDVVPPVVPEANPMTWAKVELGRHLFYEPRLSMTGELSCGSCHEQDKGFTVAEATHEGATGDYTPRNALGLANVAYAPLLTWGNPTLATLEDHMLNPLFGDNPVEMGAGFISGSSNHYDPQRLLGLVAQEETYQLRFDEAFADLSADERVTWTTAIDAIACFQRSLISFDSPWDRWRAGDEAALTPEQVQGRDLFFSERLACGTCHAGALLSLAFPTDGSEAEFDAMFRNTGLYNLAQGEVAYLDGSRSRYPSPNNGIGEFTQRPEDDGKHRIPSLRNVAETAPYMHDGSVATLDEVLDHYARGGRLLTEEPYAGDGHDNPTKDPLIAGFTLTSEERQAVIAFLESLSDQGFLADPRFADPRSLPAR